jgi:hypothetical protein
MSKLQSGKRGAARSKLIPPEQIQDDRFGYLLAWLMFILFICIYDLATKLVNYGPSMQILEEFRNIGLALGMNWRTPNPWELPISMLLNLLRILFAFMLLYRQKSGLYLIIGVHIVSFVIELLLGRFSFGTLMRLLIVPGVTYWLAKPVWKYLE